MDELEELRKKRLAELQGQAQEQQAEHMQAQAQMEQLEMMVKQVLSKEALERYGNIKAAHPEKAAQLLVILGQAINSGHIKPPLSDERFKEILIRLQPEKKEFNIKHK